MASKGPPKSAARIEAERLVLSLPNTATRTIARRLVKEFHLTENAARQMVRNLRGSGIGRKTTIKPIVDKPDPWKPQSCPQSTEDEWEPLQLDCKRIGVISDLHIPHHDRDRLIAAVDHLRKSKIDCLLINGDFGDYYAISRWQKDPRKRDFKQELKLQREGLEWLRGAFPKARIVFKCGNHEDRWDHYLWNHAAEICDQEFVMLEHVLKFETWGIEMVREERPVMAGKLPILHGHELPKGLASPVNPARGAYMRTACSIMVGHSHRTSGHSEPNMWGDEVFCWSTGCLCQMHPQYARINKWNSGFAEIDVASDGSFSVRNMRIGKDNAVRSS